MKLWLLKRIDDEAHDWGADYDEYVGFVVRAPDEAKAREMAWIGSGGEYGSRREPYWQHPDQTSCVEIPVDGDEGVILDSFRAG